MSLQTDMENKGLREMKELSDLNEHHMGKMDHFDIFTSNFLWLKDVQPRLDNTSMQKILPLLLAIQHDKEGGYGSSWKKNGEYRSIIPNIDRKYDRIDNIISQEICGARPQLPREKPPAMSIEEWDELVGESKIDAVADLADYCLLYMSWLMEEYPDAFDTWVRKNVPKYARDSIPFLQK